MNTNFSLDYRFSEAAESRRVLNRVLYGRRRWLSAAAILVPFLIYVGFAVYSNSTLWMGDKTAPVIVGVGVILLIWVRFAAPVFNRRQAMRAAGVAAREGREIDYDFGVIGYRIHTEHFEGFQKWTGVDRIIDQGDFVLIVVGAQAHFLPARMFASPEDRKAFVAWAVSMLPGEAQLRSKIGKTSRIG